MKEQDVNQRTIWRGLRRAVIYTITGSMLLGGGSLIQPMTGFAASGPTTVEGEGNQSSGNAGNATVDTETGNSSTNSNVNTNNSTATSTDTTINEGTTSSEMIRVAMFANLDSRSPGHTNQVTLSSASGLSFQSRQAAGEIKLGSTQARFSLDDYQVKVYESKDRASALTVLKRVQALNTGRMIQVTRRGVTFYAVYAGGSATQAQATQTMQKLQGDSTLAGLIKGYTPRVAGPHYLQAGTYASVNEAKAAQKLFLDADFDAYVVSMESGGKHYTSVWVGQAGSAAELDTLSAQISKKVSSVAVRAVQSTGALIHTLEDNGSGTLAHYKIYGTQKWAVKSSDPIQVTERSKRTYRGLMEVGVHKQELALVNELPLEQYLYSVVGSEVYTSWPAETLKAQAVAARTFALYQNGKFEIANVVDTTVSQAYFGIEKEHPNVIAAVDATAGEVLLKNGKLIESIFHSNAGGITADTSEVWGGTSDWYKVVTSPDDVIQASKQNWYYVVLPSGKVGYVREDVVSKNGNKNSAGFEIAYAKENDTNIRPIPAVQSTVSPVAQVDKGTQLVILDTVPESSEYAWFRGPYTGSEITNMITSKTKTPLTGSAYSLEVTDRGPSGRVTEMKVNGVEVVVSYPDNFRSAFGGLPSTLFDVESSSSYYVVGADGKAVMMNGVSGKSAISASSSTPQSLKDGTIVMNGDGEGRVLTATPSFTFSGKGYGHGIGLSQWGAKGLADQGYDYKQILQYYYNNVDIVKR